jgi:hypothetical protein
VEARRVWYLFLHEELGDEDVVVEAVDHVPCALARQAVEGDVERVDGLVLLQHTGEVHDACDKYAHDEGLNNKDIEIK